MIDNGLVSISVNIKRSLKKRADTVKERRGDLTAMIERGLENEVEKREQRKLASNQKSTKDLTE
jgi:hypothetical protein